MTNLVILYMQ